jgi:hypothetical protein
MTDFDGTEASFRVDCHGRCVAMYIPSSHFLPKVYVILSLIRRRDSNDFPGWCLL